MERKHHIAWYQHTQRLNSHSFLLQTATAYDLQTPSTTHSSSLKKWHRPDYGDNPCNKLITAGQLRCLSDVPYYQFATEELPLRHSCRLSQTQLMGYYTSSKYRLLLGHMHHTGWLIIIPHTQNYQHFNKYIFGCI